MAFNDDFIHISTGSSDSPTVSDDFFANTKGARQYTEGFMVDSLRTKHPKHLITVVSFYTCDLLAFADSRKDITYSPLEPPNRSLLERQFRPPARRHNDDNGGSFVDRVVFGSYDYSFQGEHFLVYIVEGSDGQYKSKFNYVLHEGAEDGSLMAQKKTDELIMAATKYQEELHDEVLVFDNGFWQKNKELWMNVQKSNWEDVILEEERKKSIIEDVTGFFNVEERYREFGVPWKASGRIAIGLEQLS